jgi:transposase
MSTPRRKFSREFKLEAVRLVSEEKSSLVKIAKDLGVRPDTLRNWRTAMEGRAGLTGARVSEGDSPALGRDEELRQLRRENEVLRQELDFVKKAAAYFAKQTR